MKSKKIQLWLHKHNKELSSWALVVVATIIMIGVFQQTAVFNKLTHIDEQLDTITYSPLVFDRSQNVLRVPPTFHLDEPVRVEAVFNNSDVQTVGFKGAVHWRLISPSNNLSEIFQFEFQSEVPPGCKEFHFDNIAPKEVKKITKEFFDKGENMVVWQILGDNTITYPQLGASVTFITEQFTYIPNAMPLPEHETIHTVSCD